MRNILLLGGTRFVGKKVLKLLQEQSEDKIFVASRREIDVENFIKFDRKNNEDLENIFSQYTFDVVVDFINFSASDSQILLSVLKNCGREPHLISISTIYAYNRPEDIKQDKIYREDDFDPKAIEPDLEMSSGWDYTKGKRSMEAFISQNYSSSKSTVIRFPIVLGEDDYTKRAYFFRDIIKNEQKICLTGRAKRSNYIFSSEAAEAIFFFISTEYAGVYNVALNEAFNEKEILELYCEFYGKKSEEVLQDNLEVTESPYFYKNDFLVDTSKFQTLHGFNITFKDALFRELEKMEK